MTELLLSTPIPLLSLVLGLYALAHEHLPHLFANLNHPRTDTLAEEDILNWNDREEQVLAEAWDEGY